MSISVSSIRPNAGVSYTSNVRESYALENQSEISDAYVNSIKNLSSSKVEPANPVQYANASRVNTAAPVQNLEETQRMSQAYNDIAESFGGQATSYAGDMMASSYATIGQNIDLYA